MVKYCFFFWFVFLFAPLSSDPIVESSIASTLHPVGLPIKVTMTITHKETEDVAIDSFEMNGKMLNASLVQNAVMPSSKEWLVSVYEFELPPQEKEGLFLLPAVRVKISGKYFQAHPVSYQVKNEPAKIKEKISVQKEEPLVFRLEAFIDSPKPLYPGQRAYFIYRISFNRSIDLSHSYFPLLSLDMFKRIGDVKVIDEQKNDTLTTQELVQEVEALVAGDFSIPSSSVEGYAYEMEKGVKVYDTQLLKAETPPFLISVAPFPEQNIPTSFTGAIGKITAKTELLSPSSLAIGETLVLKLTVGGISNLGELKLPPLICQPGFSGFFQMDDLPPLGDVEGEKKIFLIKLRPLIALMTALPSIELSSFDPEKKAYEVIHTSQIPIQMDTLVTEIEKEEVSPFSPSSSWPVPSLSALPFSEDPFSLSVQENKTSFPSFWKGTLLALALLILQWKWKKHLNQEKMRSMQSKKLFQEALHFKGDRKTFSYLMEKALLMYFEESREPKREKVIRYMERLQEAQYGCLDEALTVVEMKKEIEDLFRGNSWKKM